MQKDRNQIISLICGIKKQKTSKKTRTEKLRYRQQKGGYQRGRGQGENEEGGGGPTHGDRRRPDFRW